MGIEFRILCSLGKYEQLSSLSKVTRNSPVGTGS